MVRGYWGILGKDYALPIWLELPKKWHFLLDNLALPLPVL